MQIVNLFYNQHNSEGKSYQHPLQLNNGIRTILREQHGDSDKSSVCCQAHGGFFRTDERGFKEGCVPGG
jgi:hypothetical protein